MECNFSKVAFSVLGWPIHWYSLAYIFGVLIAFFLTKHLNTLSKFNIPENLFDAFLNWLVIGIIFGGRLGYVLFYDFDYYATYPLEIIKIWKGGMAFYGGILGVILSTFLFCKKYKVSFWSFIDLWSVSAPIGLFLGRIANFINGELLGKKADIFWGVIFEDKILRHPSQLYEAFLEGFLLFLIMLFCFKTGFFKRKGFLAGTFCFGYGFFRFMAEFFREPDSYFSYNLLETTGLNLNQYFSIVIFLIGIILIYRSKGKINESK